MLLFPCYPASRLRGRTEFEFPVSELCRFYVICCSWNYTNDIFILGFACSHVSQACQKPRNVSACADPWIITPRASIYHSDECHTITAIWCKIIIQYWFKCAGSRGRELAKEMDWKRVDTCHNIHSVAWHKYPSKSGQKKLKMSCRRKCLKVLILPFKNWESNLQYLFTSPATWKQTQNGLKKCTDNLKINFKELKGGQLQCRCTSPPFYFTCDR